MSGVAVISAIAHTDLSSPGICYSSDLPAWAPRVNLDLPLSGHSSEHFQ